MSPVAFPAVGAAAVRAVRAAVGEALGASYGRWDPGMEGADELAAAVRRHRVAGLLATADLDLGPDHAEVLAQARADRMAALRAVHALRAALAAVDGTGVRVLVVKGPALAAQAHGDFAVRGFGDVDLLVHPDGVAAAHGALLSAGWYADGAAPSPGGSWAWRHLVSTFYEVTLSGAVGIDLHWRLDLLPRALPEFDALWARRVQVGVAGAGVPTLGPWDALAHSATHAARDDWAWLRSLVDVHRLAGDHRTWEEAVYPLRNAQLASLGLAEDAFGPAAGMPSGVRELAQAAASPHRARTLELQAAEPDEWRRSSIPVLQTLRRHGRTSRHPADLARIAWGRALGIPALTASQETSAIKALPAVVRRRARDVRRRVDRRF